MTNNDNSSLTEPFLGKTTASKDSTTSTCSRCTKCSSLLLGSLVALVSQFLLAAALTAGAEHIVFLYRYTVVLSAAWSVATCGVVFVAMKAWTGGVIGNSSSLQKQFELEGHVVSGALLAVAFYWIASDVLLGQHSVANNNSHHSCCGLLLLAMVALVYGSIVALIVGGGDRRSSSSLMSTYHVVASVLGWIVGLCSQFVLSVAFVWMQHAAAAAAANKQSAVEPQEDNEDSSNTATDKISSSSVYEIVLFSLVWSVCTVVLTYAGCYALRCLVVEDGDEEQEKSSTTRRTLPGYWKAKVQLRMESCYILAALLGICAAWILMDVVLDLVDQIVPSLTLLALAVTAFLAIVNCFPEEECLQEYYVATNDSSDDKEQETLVDVQVV